ncbi:MAG: tetratricopeptide repeat protein [Pyrinomonadaceae bacterium]
MPSDKLNFFESNRDLLVLAGLAALVFAIYAQTSGFQYINLDDNYYVYENPAVLSGINWETVKWAFTSFHAGNWHPLTWISLALDVQLFGTSPGMHHVVNVILHFVNSVLAFVVFRRMTRNFWASAVIAALFAAHPMHVESVAWIAERKDLLSTMFWFLAMLFYVRWTKEGAKPWGPLYLAALGMFALGLMSKPMVITLPFVLMLCDAWPLERTRDAGTKGYARLVLEKAPFFVLSLSSALITLAAQRAVSAVESLAALPLDVRIQNAILSYSKYLVSAFYPAGLAIWYPYEKDLSLTEVGAALTLLIAITAISVWQFRQKKYLLFGWLWFVGTFVPVIGIVQVGGQSMADRYTYIPYLGLFVIVVFGASDLVQSFNIDRRVAGIAAASLILVLAILAYFQTGYWRDNETLYSRALSVTSKNFLIEQNFCHALMQQDRLDEAEILCQDSLEHRPDYFEALNTLGIISFKRKEYAVAESRFKSAVNSGRIHPLVYLNLSLAQILQGRPADGEINMEKAVALSGAGVSPMLFNEALTTLVDAYLKQGNFGKAAENLKRLRFIQPNNIEVRLKLVEALIELKQYPEAEGEVEAVIKMDQNNPVAWNSLGLVLLLTSDAKAAVGAFEKALTLRPDYPEAKENLRRASGKRD